VADYAVDFRMLAVKGTSNPKPLPLFDTFLHGLSADAKIY
jgi:hypothetical protein